MGIKAVPNLGALVLLLSVACFSYEQRVRPVRPDECPPEPPRRVYSRIQSDPTVPGVFHGRVRAAVRPGSASDALSDSTMPSLAQASITIASAHRNAYSDSIGQYLIDSLAPGRYAVRILRVGYVPRSDTIVVTEGAGVIWDMALEPSVMDGCPGFMGVVERRRVWRWPWQ